MQTIFNKIIKAYVKDGGENNLKVKADVLKTTKVKLKWNLKINLKSLLKIFRYIKIQRV